VEHHKKKLAFYGKVELVGQYHGDSVKTEYLCLIHSQILLGRPTNMGKGRGLACCRKALGFDGLSSILDETFRAPLRDCWLYLFRMKHYRGLIKLGIASFMDNRPDEEYGDLIRSWHFDNRIDAALVEEALKQSTGYAADCPTKLQRWPGRTEIRKIVTGR
jgi:hypothetical protein